MNNHTNQSQLTNDADFTLDSITVTMTNQSTCYNKFSLFTVRLSNCCLLKKTAISYKKKKMDEKPIRQSSLVVLQVLCVKLKCLVQLESAVIHHQVLLGRGSRKRWKQSRLIFHIINSSKGNNFCQTDSIEKRWKLHSIRFAKVSEKRKCFITNSVLARNLQRTHLKVTSIYLPLYCFSNKTS